VTLNSCQPPGDQLAATKQRVYYQVDAVFQKQNIYNPHSHDVRVGTTEMQYSYDVIWIYSIPVFAYQLTANSWIILQILTWYDKWLMGY